MTRVINLKTGGETYYTITPEKAVVCAYNQSRGNYNSFSYDFSIAKKSASGKTVSCGDFAAML